MIMSSVLVSSWALVGLTTGTPSTMPTRTPATLMLEGDVRDRERGAGARQGDDVGIDLRIDREHGDDDVDVVAETIGEERPDRAVDDARCERRLLRRPALALDEAAGYLAGCVHALFVIDGQGEELDALAGV